MADIAVITSVHPAKSEYLMDAYESLQMQTVDWQWSVYFDGSGPEHPLEMVGDPRVTVRRGVASKGASHGRNSAVLMSDAPLIRNLDGDDLLAESRSLEDCCQNLARPGIGYCLSPTIDRDVSGAEQVFSPTFTPYGRIPLGYWGAAWERQRFLDVRVHTLACRRDVYWMCGGYRAMDFAEDVTLVVAMSELVAGWLERRPGSVYRSWPGQVSAAKDRPWQLDATYSQVTEAVVSFRKWVHHAD